MDILNRWMGSSRFDGFASILRFTALGATGLVLCASLAGCGTSKSVLTTRAQPVVVTPPTPSWEVPVGIELKPNGILVRVENRSSEPISVIWEESSYIDVNQRTHPVVPASSAAVGGRLPSSVLPPGTRLEELLTPARGVGDDTYDPILSDGQKGKWWMLGRRKEPMRVGSHIQRDSPALGKEIGVFLVLEKDAAKRTVLAKYTLSGN